MSRVSVFSNPLMLGFDQFEQVLDRIHKTATDGYPPYNIEQIGETGLRITLAVAGFRETDLSIDVENNQLAVRGRQLDDESRTYLHRGIAARQFQKSFVLAEGIEIAGASLEAGLLHIDLRRPQTEARVRNIPIRTEAGRTEAGRTEAGRTEAGRTEAGRTEAGRTEAGRTEAGRTEAGRTEAGRTEAGRTEAGRTAPPIAGDVAAE